MDATNNDAPFTLRVLIVGEAGDGVLSAGDTFMRTAAASGFHSSVHNCFPPTIRGGICSVLVTVSDDDSAAPLSTSADFVFALSRASLVVLGGTDCAGGVDRVNDAINRGTDISAINTGGDGSDDTQSFKLDFGLCPHINTHPQLKSSFVIGVLSAILGIPENLALGMITEKLKSKNLTAQNEESFKTGFGSASSDILPALRAANRHALRLASGRPVSEDQVILDGNRAIALGAISAGCRIYASYPISPATPIGTFMATYLPAFGGFAYQAEDEISAIGAVAGAWFFDIPAMTATSGPGLSLMQEFLGYCSMTETPAVIVDVQRAGPSTGMPTKHSQDDLMAVIFGGHGEGQRIVLAASTIDECFHLTIEAFYMARHFRCPVILLTDGALGNLQMSCKRPDPSFNINGYHITQPQNEDAAVSTATPQTAPTHIEARRVTGLEHDPKGMPNDTSNNRVRQQYKRFSKMDKIDGNCSYLQTLDIGDLKPPLPKSRFSARLQESLPKADLCVISWGFDAAMTRVAVSEMRKRGIKIACLYPRLLFPFVNGHYMELLNFCPRIAVVESNYTGQLAALIRMNTEINPISVKKYNGEPFTPEEIEAELCGIINMEKFISDMSETNNDGAAKT
ncbi:MAG: 2-oxoacid:acceptor oxidoreductase family protein [Chitinispirillales bacterium]|jgi:2-oxoglutarate ferredoxin oxidoreductase subunit alpha|nr:2-oxoacid:acceptor oxidoreductase family protein [Chitinispirillales bacterium]